MPTTLSAAALRRPAWLGLAGTALVVGLAVSCQAKSAGDDTPVSLPDKISDMGLVDDVSGNDAAAMIKRLHGKDVAPTASRIGHYGMGATRATLYVSRFPSAADARSRLSDMSEHIGEGSSGFGHHERFNVDGREVHMVLGQGQVHYFYADGSHVVWLAVAPHVARSAVAELLGSGVEAVPTLESMLGTPPSQ